MCAPDSASPGVQDLAAVGDGRTEPERVPPSRTARALPRTVCRSALRLVSRVQGNIRARYCLFGDVVNVASRMESTCKANHIQVSQVSQTNEQTDDDRVSK
eukprot:1183228-Prorocentrum_minimum.AAC.2